MRLIEVTDFECIEECVHKAIEAVKAGCNINE